jgi:Tol biopolymer transport system component
MLLAGCGKSAPHGTIAFSGVVHGVSGIYLTDADGRQVRRVADLGSQLAWSGDGHLLAFERGNQVWVVAASGGRPTRAIQGPAYDYTLSPDGGRFVFRGDDFALFVASVGDATRRLTDDARNPAWSPDGKWVAFITGVAHVNDYGRYDYIAIVHPDGTGRQRLQLQPGIAVGASWAPDSKRLVFTAPADGLDGDLYTVRRDGTDLRKVLPRSRYEPSRVSWSPDDKRIAFSDGTGTWVVDWTGSHLHRVSQLGGASWSPDGRWLVVHDANRLRIVGVDGKRARSIVVADSIAATAWSPRR